jgi:gamma-glutamylcyclotransferase (GGCT)/AIG2-like uncharacterized protein YtfP
MTSVFVYGTLLEDRRAQGLLGRLPHHRPAKLLGYARYRVRGAPFPAIIPESGSSVEGRVRCRGTATAPESSTRKLDQPALSEPVAHARVSAVFKPCACMLPVAWHMQVSCMTPSNRT